MACALKKEKQVTNRVSISAIFLLIHLSCFAYAQERVGCPGTDYPAWETSPYILPFAVGETYRVKLGNCSSSFHSASRPDSLAYDFVMDIGTPILASRAGRVIHVEESGVDFRHPNNLVIIDHGDATFAEYMHLTKDGAEVEVGDRVEQGDLVGYSGATGLAGYPHLHFIVVKDNPRWPYKGVAVTFSNTAPNPRGLTSYTDYKALPYE